MKNEIELIPSYWASVSGGKDSLYMLYLILQNPDKYKLDGVVHFELEIDYPFIKNVIDYMESECKKHGVKFVRIKPSVSYFDLLEKYGVPTRVARWCNNMYKLNALNQLKAFLKEKGYNLVSYIGYCYDEESRWKDRKTSYKEIYPLVDFQIEEKSILDWAKTQPIFNNYYITNKRCGCMYCPMSSKINLAYLLKYYPEQYHWFITKCKETELIREVELGRKFSIWATNTKYDSKYIDSIIHKKWLPRLEETEKEYYENLS